MKQQSRLILFLLFTGCVPDMTPEKKILKKLELENMTLEWSSTSSAYANVPEIITVKTDNRFDTLVRASNIAAMTFSGNNTVTIGFWGRPKLYAAPVHIPATIYKKYSIIIDTTYISPLSANDHLSTTQPH